MSSQSVDDPLLPFCDPSEELANTVTHAFGAFLSVLGAAGICWLAYSHGRDIWQLASFGVYAFTLIALYLASTLYHYCKTPETKSWLRTVDHAGIFLFFGGSYTPFAMVCLGGDERLWLFLFFAWGIALAGMAVKLFFFNGAFCVPSIIIYLMISSLIYLSLEPIFAVLSTGRAFPLLFGGFAAYIIGIGFFLWESLPYNHAIWHLFVILACVCHYLAALMLIFA